METHPEYEFIKESTGVIHVGASYGQERDIYADAGLPVIWIEAIPEVYEALAGNLIGRYRRQKAVNCLITDQDDVETEFFIANNGGMSSSVLRLGDHQHIWPDIAYIYKLLLKSKRLDTALADEDLSQYNTLVLDVQGAELKVLAGAENVLKHMKFIRCEAADFHIYEDCALDWQLDEFFQKRGFQRVKFWQFDKTLTTPGKGMYEILYQRASTVKNTRIIDPQTGKETWARVGVVTSVPRVGFQIHETMMHASFGSKGWPVVRVGGAYWEQAMQNGLNLMIRMGCDYIITVDFDSIFNVNDVDELVLMATRYPEADAVASWQPKRQGKGESLMGFKDENGKFMPNVPLEYLAGEVSQADHTVFGLTLIKAEALKKMPKPWLQSFPNADGKWADGKTDADGYFWDKWGKTGLTIYSANNAKIGQLEEYIRWTGPDYKVIDQQLSEYYKNGRPF